MTHQTPATYNEISDKLTAYVNDRWPPISLPAAVRDGRLAALTGALTGLVRMASIYMTEESSKEFLADLAVMEASWPVSS